MYKYTRMSLSKYKSAVLGNPILFIHLILKSTNIDWWEGKLFVHFLQISRTLHERKKTIIILERSLFFPWKEKKNHLRAITFFNVRTFGSGKSVVYIALHSNRAAAPPPDFVIVFLLLLFFFFFNDVFSSLWTRYQIVIYHTLMSIKLKITF